MKLVIASLLLLAPLQAQVKVWEGTMKLPTYEEAAPDPNPPFDLFATNRFNYPYTLRENLSGRRVDVEWRALFLENEYLKCSVLPDIGGHLYTCVDKISGQPMFYANPSIKKARIGYRGAWAAFGIEFNFPVSHNWLSMSPVQFAKAQHTDGSASVYVGATDRVYGMEWMVELKLTPGSTVLEQHVTLTNRSDVRHRFYWWNNAGVRVWDDSRVQYPMQFAASHGFTEVKPWPVDDKGRDLSLISNQVYGPVSMFTHASREPFMGVYHPHTQTGVAHYADYGELPAKKIWSWGVDPDGLDWRRALSDDNSAYVEVQAGLFRNQETYAFLEPRELIQFNEYWMPVRQIGGISRATLAGVTHLQRAGEKVTVGINANREYNGATVRISAGNKELLREQATLKPAQTWSRVFDSSDKLTVELISAKGEALLKQTEGEYDWTPAAEVKTGPQNAGRRARATAEDDALAEGQDQELNGAIVRAMDTYVAALQKSPTHLMLRKTAGRLATSLLRYDEAIQYLEPAQAQDTADPEIAYYLGMAYNGVGQTSKARLMFEAAHRLPSFRAAGALRLAELTAQQGDREAARKYLVEAHATAPADLRVAEELIALDRALGHSGEASELETSFKAQRPTSLFLSRQMNGDADRVLRVAEAYMRVGLWKPALDVLRTPAAQAPESQREPGVPAPAEHPMLAYYAAYCQQRLGQDATADLTRAARMSTRYVFPGGEMALSVLNSALAANTRDASALYLRGNLLMNSGLVDRALNDWRTAQQINPEIPVLASSLGRVLLEVKHQPDEALTSFRSGLKTDRTNAVLYSGSLQAMSILRRPASERVAVLEQYPDAKTMPAALVYELALNLAEAGRFEDAEKQFAGRFFAREEGGTNVRQVWIETRLLHALGDAKSGRCQQAGEIAHSLGTAVSGLDFTRDGLDRFIRQPRTQYLLGEVFASCKDETAAEPFFISAAKANGALDLFWAAQAAQHLPNYDAASWNSKITSALEGSRLKYADNPGAIYTRALLETWKRSETTDVTPVFLSSDRNLLHHLTRMLSK